MLWPTFPSCRPHIAPADQNPQVTIDGEVSLMEHGLVNTLLEAKFPRSISEKIGAGKLFDRAWQSIKSPVNNLGFVKKKNCK